MVLTLPNLRKLGQQLIKIIAPARGVFTVPIFIDLGPTEDLFDAASYRPAVSDLIDQIGSSTRWTWPTSISRTGSSPKMGSAYVVIVVPHCAACLAFFSPLLRIAM